MVGRKLLRPILGLEEMNGRKRIVAVPADAAVELLALPRGTAESRNITITWDNRIVVVVQVELQNASQPLADQVGCLG